MSEHEETRHALAGEFPGWLITAAEDGLGVSWSAGRALAPGHGGVVGLLSDHPALLRELLTEAERCDSRLALRELAARLAERGLDGVTIRAYDTNLILTGPGERERLIVCGRGTFRWGMGGEEIGPLGDVTGAVEQIAGAGGMSPP